jgi:REP-associated tyrosine transposase
MRNKMKDEKFFAWQSRFYEHIVGTEEAFQKVREYINDNPLKWELDEENPKYLKK